MTHGTKCFHSKIKIRKVQNKPICAEIRPRVSVEHAKAKKWVDKLGLEWAMKAIKHHESHLGMA